MYALVTLLCLTLYFVHRIGWLIQSGWVLTSGSIICAALGWYNHNVGIFFFSIAAASGFLTIVLVFELLSNDFLLRNYKRMPRDRKCCLPWFNWSTPDSVLWLTCVFRILSGLATIVACYLTWSHRVRFWQKHYSPVSVPWGVAACLWLCSAIPHTICLLQCAAGRVDPKLILFRKRVAMWVLHDIVLGCFFLYLSIMLYDLADDEDDSEWRTIFLSMLSWHIVIVVVQQVYFSNIWSETLSSSCCAPEMRTRWRTLALLLSVILVYSVVITFFKSSGSISMGCSLSQLVLFCVAIVLGCLSKISKGKPHPNGKLVRDVVKPVSLDF